MREKINENLRLHCPKLIVLQKSLIHSYLSIAADLSAASVVVAAVLACPVGVVVMAFSNEAVVAAVLLLRLLLMPLMLQLLFLSQCCNCCSCPLPLVLMLPLLLLLLQQLLFLSQCCYCCGFYSCH